MGDGNSLSGLDSRVLRQDKALVIQGDSWDASKAPPPGFTYIIRDASDGRTKLLLPTGSLIDIQTPPQLNTTLASAFCYGDSQTLGVGDNVPTWTTSLATSNMAIGTNATGSYREQIYQQMLNQGILIPSTTWFKGGVTATTPNLPSGQLAHEGHSGETLANMNTNYVARYNANPGAFIILSGGINDLNNGNSPQQAATALGTLLATIFANNPTVPVLFSVPPAGSAILAQMAAFAALVPAVIAAAVALGQKVWLVDPSNQVKGDGVSGLMADTLHPNFFGYRMWAGIILRALLAYPF